MALHSVSATVTAGTPVALASQNTPCTWVHIKALKASGAANAGNVYVGGSDVSVSNGYCLTTGQEVLLPQVPSNPYDLKYIFIDGGTNGDEVKVLYFTR